MPLAVRGRDFIVAPDGEIYFFRDPTEDEIRARRLEIQKTWTPGIRQDRIARGHHNRAWRPPVLPGVEEDYLF